MKEDKLEKTKRRTKNIGKGRIKEISLGKSTVVTDDSDNEVFDNAQP